MNIVDINNLILFEDDEVVVVDKPSGLLSIPDGYDLQKNNLRTLLEQKYKRIWVVHRLDKDSSGVIIFAKNSKSHKSLNQQFSERIIRKKYIAISYGVPFWSEQKIIYPLKTDGDRKHRTIVDNVRGKKAETFVRVKESMIEKCKFEIMITTGITHQIRSHLASMGFPIVGDTLYRKYCFVNDSEQENQLQLNANSIEFHHPILNLKIFVKSRRILLL